MQAIAPVTLADLESPLIVPLSKLEIYYGGSWQTPQAISGESRAILMNVSTSIGAVAPTTYVVAGTWTAKVYNPEAVFHPLNSGSVYTDVFAIGRKIRISQGIKIGETGVTDYYWEAMYGIISDVDFDLNGNCVDISGMDYCQALVDYKLRRFLDQAFGGTRAFQIAAGTVADTKVSNGNFTTNTTNWVGLYASLASVAGGQDGNCLELTRDSSDKQWAYSLVQGLDPGILYRCEGYVKAGTSGNEAYRVTVGVNPGTDETVSIEGTASGAWVRWQFDFMAPNSAGIWISVEKSTATAGTMLFDTISCYPVVKNRYPMDAGAYPLEAAATGAYLILQQLTVGPPATWQDYFENEHWTWDSTVPELVFNSDFDMPAPGAWFTAYVFEALAPEDVVFFLLANSWLYAGYAAAKADATYTPTGFNIDRVSFPPGTSAFQAIQQLAERCNYQFFFRYNGKPVFIPKPAIKAWGSEDLALLKNYVANVRYIKNKKEFYNSITIEGEAQAHPTSKEKSETSALKGTALDAVSIAASGEKNFPINNTFWQTQVSIDASAAALLAALKDPKAYFPFDLIFCPIPIERGDTIDVTISLPLTPGLAAADFGISDFGLCDFGAIGAGGLSVSVHGLVRSIKVNDFSQSVILELGA